MRRAASPIIATATVRFTVVWRPIHRILMFGKANRPRGSWRRWARHWTALNASSERECAIGACCCYDSTKSCHQKLNEERTHGRTPQSHHHLRHHRLDPYAVDVTALADYTETDRGRRRGRGGGGRCDRSSACARSRRRSSDAGPKIFPRVRLRHQASL